MSIRTVLVTGGTGYVGAVLVPRLLENKFKVKVLDLNIYGELRLKSNKRHKHLLQIKGDIRDQSLLKNILRKCDAVIHLACISNDPSFELQPTLSREINYDAFEPLVRLSKNSGIKRFIYASSASVYGVSDAPEINENHPLVPLTDYNKFKGMCEPILLKEKASDFTPVVIRPATICGYSPRQRFDLTVNILTNYAVNLGKITVFGGKQKRPNIHIDDMVDLYIQILKEPDSKISGKIYNAGYQNHTVTEIANIVRSAVQKKVEARKNIEIITTPSDDIRSYHISSEKIKKELNFMPKRTIENAVCDLCAAFKSNQYYKPMTNPIYYNIKRMKEIRLS